MLLIAESGSTKTDWCLAKDYENLERFSTNGLNPYFYDQEGVRNILKKELPSHLPFESLEQIYFYGAGCSSEIRKARVKGGLKSVFSRANIEVEHDLLGSARALCGNEKGIATILGTGSNACLFDGQKITDQSGGIGFILGDEGSGADLGKRFLRSYFYGELPDEILKAFEQEFSPDKDEIVDHVYQKPNPNRYLASYAKFIQDYSDHAFMQALIENAFSDFINRHILKFEKGQKLPMHSVGSIAYYFEPFLKPLVESNGIEMGRIIVKPIDNLIEFHLEGGQLRNQGTS